MVGRLGLLTAAAWSQEKGRTAVLRLGFKLDGALEVAWTQGQHIEARRSSANTMEAVTRTVASSFARTALTELRRCGRPRRGRSCEPKARATLSNTRANKGNRERPKGDGGDGYSGRGRRKLPAEPSFSGEELLRLRGELETGQRGELERKAVALRSRKQQAIQWR